MSEVYSLSPNTGDHQNFLIFANSPFLLDSLTVTATISSESTSSIPLGVATPLVLGVDYFPALQFNQATFELGQPVYGGISFTDPLLAGSVTVNYTPLGHGYSLTGPQLTAVNALNIDMPLVALWEEVIPGIANFPVQSLTFNPDVPVGVSNVVTSVNSLVTAIDAVTAKTSVFNFNNHIADTNNPHFETAYALGLGNIPNWRVGIAADVIDGSVIDAFVTPEAVAESVNTVVPAAAETVVGKVALNLGTTAGDGTNSTDALTTNGLVYLISNSLIPELVAVMNDQRHAVVLSPNPIHYPAIWNGVTCHNFSDLVAAVSAYTGIVNLTSSDKLATIYFPHSVAPPSLVHT